MAKNFFSKYVKDVKFLRILKVRGSVLKVRGSVLKSIPRFGRFEVRFPEVREVRGSEFSGSTQHYTKYNISCLNDYKNSSLLKISLFRNRINVCVDCRIRSVVSRVYRALRDGGE